MECTCYTTSDGDTIICPACAEAALQQLLQTPANPAVTEQEQEDLITNVNQWLNTLS